MRRSLSEHAPLIEHRHPVREGLREVEIVLDEQHGDVRRKREQKRPDALALCARQAGERFVEQQQRRPLHQGARDLQLAQLAVRQRHRRLEDLPGEPDGGRDVARGGFAVGNRIERLHDVPRVSGALQRTCPEVVEQAELGQHVAGLERARHAKTRDALRRHAGRATLCDLNMTARRRELSADDGEERALAGAVRADDGAAFGALHAQAHAVEREDAAEALGHRFDEQLRHCASPSSKDRAA